MQRLMIIFAIFLAASPNIIANNNREPDSPKGHYKFSLMDIQNTVRAGVIKADEMIRNLTQSGELQNIAHAYFEEYLQRINSYNMQKAQTVDLVESYKTDLTNAYVLKEFKENYPHLIYDRSKWFFNSVGGVYASTLLIYASNKEYIVLWGTTLRADNKFSGYYSFMNEFDVMVRGRMESHDVNAPGHASVIYYPIMQDGIAGSSVDTSNLIPKNVRSYNLAPHTYMISYAQGNIAKAFIPGAIMPGVFVNQDWAGLSAHIKESYRSFKFSIKRYKQSASQEQMNFSKNPNYRAIWIIDTYRQGTCSK